MRKISKRNIFMFSLFFLFLALSLTVYSRTKAVYESQSLGCFSPNMSGEIDLSELTYTFAGKKGNIPQIALAESEYKVLGETSQEKWVEVDLSDQKLYAWEEGNLFLETPISTGLVYWPTPEGEFRVWIKLRATKMEGGSGKYYYNLPNVPYVMFFENEKVPGRLGYGLHGTYWHDDFGTPRSHGCVNLPTPMAEKLYYWIGPVLGSSRWVAKSTSQNLGTRVVIHK